MSDPSPGASHIGIPATGRLSLFEFSQLGHYPYYLRLVIERCCSDGYPGLLDLVVTPRFAEYHPEVLALAGSSPGNRIRIHVLSRSEQTWLDEAQTSRVTSLSGLLKAQVDEKEAAVRRWRLVARYAEKLETTHCLITHLDSCLLAVAAGLDLPCPFSGILFRPTFHYPPLPGGNESKPVKFQRLQERLLMERMLKHPQLSTVFCLDPTALEPLRAYGDNIRYLPDPVPPRGPNRDVRRTQFRRSLGIDNDTLMLLAFGDISKRKGIVQLFEAFDRLPDKECEHISLVVAGAVKSFDEEWLRKKIDSLNARFPVKARTCYVPEEDVDAYFSASDLVLAPYQRHAGMSGILLRAAAQGKPVITQSYGLMGHLTRKYGLGSDVDTGDASQILLALRRFIRDPMEHHYDHDGMRRLAEEHDESRFAQTLLTHLRPQNH